MTKRDSPASISRREALKITGGALAITRSAVFARPQTKTSRKVIVAGAGISGLSCGYELMKRGHEVTVLEALGRSGGHVLTVRDNLPDGLYADAGAEHFYRQAYQELYRYIEEFDLPVIPYPRRDHMVQFIDGKPYTEEMLADAAVLKRLSLNQREVEYLTRHHFSDFNSCFLGPYLDSFRDETHPLDAGLNQLDHMTVSQLMQKDGASSAAIKLAGGSSSALYSAWQLSNRKKRGVTTFVRPVYRVEGGNQRITDTLAAKLGERLRLGCPLSAIEYGQNSVTVSFQEFGRPRKLEADYLVLSMPFRALRSIAVTPAWPEAKRYVIENMHYDLKARVIFQSRTKFWNTDRVSPNMEVGTPEIADIWAMAEDVKTPRGLLIGQARSSSIDASLTKYRQIYPGKSEDIEQALIVNWTLDPFAGSCLPLALGPGELPKFWPEVTRPHGRIHFASVCVDSFPNGLEAGVRAAKRAAEAISAA
jgi:monoamine oxidase